LFREEEKEEEVVGVVVGMEYFVSLADVGMQVFCFFRTRSRWGWNILCTYRMWGWNILRMWVEQEEEEGNHLRKEPVPYCVNYK
jgi:hypothetical protein